MSNSNNRNNNGNNVFNDLNNTDLLFINILNTIYNDNLRIIHQLLEQNSEVTNNLISFLNNRRRETFANNNLNQENTNANININPNPNDRRIFIDSIPYYLVDELQFFTIPSINNTNTNTNTNPNTANLRTPTNTNRGRYHRRNNINTDNLETMPTPIGRMTGIMNSFFQPINIVPTQTQIENATSNITYGEIVEPINTSCPISLETFIETSEVVMIKHCKHVFNKQSLMSWFNSSCRCPVCRYDIRDYVDAENNETTNESATADTTANINSDESVSTNPNIVAQERIRTIRELTDHTANILETLFQDTLYDLSYNRIQFSFP